nr:hypothetical protein [uncultured Dyadobacter sp.]
MKLSEEQNEELNHIKDEVRKLSPQIFVGVESGIYEKPIPNATSVLLELGGQYFVVTAGHVLASELNIGFALEKKFYPLHKDLSFHYFDSDEQTLNNKFDIGIVKIEMDTVTALKSSGFQFLNYRRINFGSSQSIDNWYLLLGYPANRIKYNLANQSFSCKSYSLLTHEVVDWHEKLGLGREYKLVAKYQKRKTVRSDNGELTIGPVLEGLSGSGLWSRVDDVTKLTAIFTDWYREHNLLTATRISVVIEVIRQRYHLALPKIEDKNLELMISESFSD